MTDGKMLKDLQSAGGWFVGLYTGIIQSQLERLETDREYKKRFIQKIHESEGRDKDLGGTTTRVNSVIRIVRSQKARAALEYVRHSHRIRESDPLAVVYAAVTLDEMK